jgi:predicted TIM-barrel fold metal-dependent hydrolase
MLSRMAVNDFLVVDCDAHYLEPINEMVEYIDEPWHSRLSGADPAKWIPFGLGDRMMAGRIRRDDVDYGYGYGVQSAAEIRATMAHIGVDASVLVPNRIVTMGHVSVRDLVVALNAGYIRYMLDKVVDPAAGVYTMVIACWQDPEASADLIDEVADHTGVAGVCMMTAGANPPLGDVRYDPIFDAAQRHDLPLVFHGAPGLNLVEGADYAGGFQRLIESHSLGFAISNQIQLTSLILQGVPERFPDLKFVFQESGLFWVPMMQYRLDEYFLKRRSEAPLLTGLPSEYIRDRFYFGTQPIEAPKDQRHLEMVFEAANGAEHFVFCSDYPHFDYDDPSAILKLRFLDASQKANVFAGNALNVFKLRKDGPQPWESISPAASTTSEKTAAP